ncbi:MAG: prohibitin family protein [Ruminococcaceae bacterium]|nr:prohibitin family protein [Oscillospiraceae bacterium]
MENVIPVKTPSTKKIAKIIVTVIIILALIILALASVKTIPAGFVGIRTQFSAVTGGYVPAGLNFKIPFIQDIVPVDCRIQKIEADSTAPSRDLQNITSKIAVNFSIDTAMATTLYKDVGVNYRAVIIDPAVQEVVKMVTAQFTAEELISKRSEVSNLMTEGLTSKISSKGIIIHDFNVINFEFSDEFDKAIEAKQVAQQQALKAEQDLARIQIEAQQKIVQAQAEAEALKLQKQEITEELLELRKIEAQLSAIEKWDGKLPTYNGSDAVPFIDITK